jgi:MFS family permease
LNQFSQDKNTQELIITTPDFKSMIRITFWNGLGFIFFSFIKSYVVIYFFGGSGVDLGIIMALQPLARLFSMPIIAYLTDHTSKKRLILIGSLGRTLAYFLYWLSLVVRNIYMFGTGVFLQGLLVGFFWPPFYSLISEKSYKGSRTEALAKGRGKMIGYGFLLGAIISIPMFTLVSLFFPENVPLLYSPLLLFAMINLIAGFQFYYKIDEDLTFEKYWNSLNESEIKQYNIDNSNTRLESNKKLKNGTNRMFLISFSIFTFAILITSIIGTMFSPFISAYLIENLLPGVSAIIIPIVVMVVYFPAQVVSQLLASKIGKIYDKISPTISVIMIGIFRAIILLLLILTLSPIDFAIVLILLYIVLESNNYFIQAIMSRVSIKHRGKVFGLHMWIDQFGRVIGPLIGGFLWDNIGYDAPFVFAIFIGICLIPVLVFSIRELNPNMVEII